MEELLNAKIQIAREEMIQLLNEDLAREYQAVISYVVYSQTLRGPEYMEIAAELKIHAGEELEHAIMIARQIDYLGGTPVTIPEEVILPDDPREMLHIDLENERITIANYRQRIQQAEAMNEYALSEVLRTIIVQEQEHEIELSTALGIKVPPPIDL